MERKSEVDPKIEGYLIYKQILCEALSSPNSIPVHLSEPFNINVEYMRISADWVDLELLCKSFQVIDKIKLNTITSIELSVNKETSLSSSTGSISTPNQSSTMSQPPQLLRSNSISGKAGSLLGISPDSSEQQTPPVSGSKKANSLLGFEDGADSQKSVTKKSSLANSSAANSPKFGLLARSASNTLLNSNFKKEQEISSSSPNTSFINMSTSPSSTPLSTSGSNPLASSTSSLSSSSGSGSSFLGGNGSNLSLSGGSSNNTTSNLGHYNQSFSVLTKSITYSFNSREKEELNAILDALKMISTGKPYQEQSNQTFDAIVEAFTIAHLCKPPIIPSLPSSPPPPPPLLKYLTQ